MMTSPMTNKKYIICKEGREKSNTFITDLHLKLPIHNCEIDCSAKIDTGCERTSIALQSKNINIGKDMALEYKKQAIEEGLSCSLSFGVNDTREFREKQKEWYKTGNFFDCYSIGFVHQVNTLSINGHRLPAVNIKVNYNRIGNVLIGLDLLKLFDFHCGKSIVNDEKDNIRKGDYIFMGCLTDSITDEYIVALEKYFGITRRYLKKRHGTV